MAGTKTLAILYPGCIALEIMTALELLNERFPVEVATPDGSPHKASNGLTVAAQASFSEVEITSYRAVVIPGGDPHDLLENPEIDGLLQAADRLGLVIGAICAGPLLPAKAGILKGRRFTHGYGDHHEDVLDPFWAGATYVDSPLVVDGTLITAQPHAHIDFGVELARATGCIEAGESEPLKRYYKGPAPQQP